MLEGFLDHLKPFLETFWYPEGLLGPLGPFLGASWGRSRFLVVFGGLLGPLLGTMLRQSRPPKLSKVTFFDFLTLPKSIKNSKDI